MNNEVRTRICLVGGNTVIGTVTHKSWLGKITFSSTSFRLKYWGWYVFHKTMYCIKVLMRIWHLKVPNVMLLWRNESSKQQYVNDDDDETRYWWLIWFGSRETTFFDRKTNLKLFVIVLTVRSLGVAQYDYPIRCLTMWVSKLNKKNNGYLNWQYSGIRLRPLEYNVQ